MGVQAIGGSGRGRSPEGNLEMAPNLEKGVLPGQNWTKRFEAVGGRGIRKDSEAKAAVGGR